MRCDQVSTVLSGVDASAADLDEPLQRHVSQCLRCQAEVVQYRKLLRALRSMRLEVVEPVPGLLPEILGNLDEAGEHRALRELLDGRRLAYLSGLAAATAAGVGGAIVIASRSKRRLRLAS